MHISQKSNFVYAMKPGDIGRMDAESGYPCRPSTYFADMARRRQYVNGYARVNLSVAVATMYGTDAMVEVAS